MFYNNQGRIKVFNGENFKTVNYIKEDDVVTFSTKKNSNKYNAIKESGKIIVEEEKGNSEFDAQIIEDETQVNSKMSYMKKKKAILFFIPKKGKVIVQFRIK